MNDSTPRQPDGYIRTVDPDTGTEERMAYWLPAGVEPEDIGLEAAAEEQAA
jgi:hypothetical protein